MTSNLTRGELHVRKYPLHSEQPVVDADATVDEAAGWANALLSRAFHGPGDTVEAATYRAEQKYGIPAQTFWALRYRKPKGILTHIYKRLEAAYEAECGRQEARLRHELEMARALEGNPSLASAIREAEVALGDTQGNEAEA